MSEFPKLSTYGVTVDWTYDFVGHGTALPSTPGQIAVDVGGFLGPGVLDHHHIDSTQLLPSRRTRSTSQIVVEHPEYIFHHLAAPVLEAAIQGRLPANHRVTFRIVTHSSPDWDGVVAIHLIRRLIEDGAFPGYAEALSKYASDVDQGRFTFDFFKDRLKNGGAPSTPNTMQNPESEEDPARSKAAQLSAFLALPHIAHLMIQRKSPSNWETLRLGLCLLEKVIESVLQQGRPIVEGDFWLGDAHRMWLHDEQFRLIAEALRVEPSAWQLDKDGAEEFRIELPLHTGNGYHSVRALALKRDSSSALNKYWARSEGYELFVCPYDMYTPHPTRGPRMIISLPDIDDQSGTPVCLRGLGQYLERQESDARRENGPMRSGPPRWAGVDNRDPWYDGRGHSFTICDSPHAGTVLQPHQILELIKNSNQWGRPMSIVEALWLDAFFEVDESQLADEICFPDGNLQKRLGVFTEDTKHWQNGLRFHTPKGPFVLPEALDGFLIEHNLLIRVNDEPSKCDFPVIRWLRLKQSGHEIPALDNLMNAEAALAEGHVYSVWSWCSSPETAASASNQVQLAESRLANGAWERQWVNQGRRLSRYRPTPIAHCNEHEELCLVVLYAAFIELTLGHFNRRIGAADMNEVESIQRHFLTFQSRYYQIAPINAPYAERCWAALAGGLNIHHYYSEVEHELNNVVSLLHGEIARRQASVLAFVSALGLIQTADIVRQNMAPASKEVFLAASTTLALVVWWWFRRK